MWYESLDIIVITCVQFITREIMPDLPIHRLCKMAGAHDGRPLSPSGGDEADSDNKRTNRQKPGEGYEMALTQDAANDNQLSDTDLDMSTTGTTMRVRKRNGDLENVDVNKIVRAIERCAEGLPGVDPMQIATRTISGLCAGATTEELDELSIRISAAFIF